MRALNFNAGPATLPLPALERAREELLDFAGTGMSVMEHSHRGKEYEAVHDEAIALLREIAGVPDTHEVLFLQGGANQQFAQIPMNFLRPGESADLVVTGAWGERALSEGSPAAKLVGGSLRVAATTIEADKGYRRVPRADEIKFDPNAAYFHVTSNETIHGVQFHDLPTAPSNVPTIVDMSSDFMWKPMDLSRFAMVYAGAQKNLGPSGISLVIARKDFIATGATNLPPLAQYRTYAAESSMHNTPNTFGVYIIGEVVAWIRAQGGLAAMAERNERKAKVVYDFLDQSKVWRGHAEPASRSRMNITFRGATKELEATLLERAEARGLSGLKGHRSVGGMRASIYNAFPEEGVHRLVQLLDDVEHGRP